MSDYSGLAIDRGELERLALELRTALSLAPSSIRVEQPYTINCYDIEGRIKRFLLDDQARLKRKEEPYITNWSRANVKGFCTIQDDAGEPLIILHPIRNARKMPIKLAHLVNFNYVETSLDTLGMYGFFGNRDMKSPMSFVLPQLAYRRKDDTSRLAFLINTIKLRDYGRTLFLDPRSVIPVYSPERGCFVVSGIPKEAIVPGSIKILPYEK